MAFRKKGKQTSVVPKGCDYQGRHPEAAEACTEIGQEDDPYDRQIGIFSVAIVFIILLIVGVLTC